MKRGPKEKKHEDVADRLNGTGLHWVGRYVNSTTKVMFGCDECGHEWMAMPGSIFSAKSGCPACFSRTKRGRNAWINRGAEKENLVLVDHGEWLEVDVSTPLHCDKVMLIDRSDYDALKKAGCGRMHVGAYGYVRSLIGGKSLLLHRLILVGAKEVDHINQNKLDNRRANLRSVEAWQNQANRGIRKNNKTGVTGVCWFERENRFCAQLKNRGRIVHQSYHKTLESAAAARAKAVAEHCGEFAPILAVTKKGS